MVGAPSKFNWTIAEKICKGIEDKKSLASICRPDDMPSTQTVTDWLSKGEKHAKDYPEYATFLEDYTHARAIQADGFVEEVIEIADDCPVDAIHIQLAKLKIDTRKWVAGKMRPKKYGLTNIKHSGDEEDPVIVSGVNVTFVESQKEKQ